MRMMLVVVMMMMVIRMKFVLTDDNCIHNNSIENHDDQNYS